MNTTLIPKRYSFPVKVSLLLVTLVLIAGTAACDGYTGPSENLEIRTWYDLDDVRDNLNGHHTLMNDLDSTTLGYDELASPTANEGKGWQPIGTWHVSPFTGIFDGRGHEISDLLIDRPDENFMGLFSYVREEGRIQDIGMVNVIVTGKRGVGGLVGRNLVGTVSNSYSTGSITGNTLVGGLVGENGGLPSSPSSVSDSYSMSSVTGLNYVGGLVGYIFSGTVTNCYSTGNVTGNSYVGGLVGYLHERIELESYVPDSSTGNIRFEGAVGLNEGSTVINCYSTGNVTGNSYVGGLVGYLEESLELGSYFPDSATGDIKFEGAVGLSEGSTVINSFWDMETSGQYASSGGTGKNTTEMQNIATFSGAGWSIILVALNETNPGYTWNIINNVTYPFLGWQS